jgi:hypothetical protein
LAFEPHVPATHASPAAHALLQAPQCAVDDALSTQVPLGPQGAQV